MDRTSTHTEQWHGSVAVIRAAGAIDMLTAPALHNACRAACSKHPSGLVVDLTDVEFLSSAGMQVLVAVHEEVTPDARFAVVADGPGTSRPLKITGLTDFIDLYATLDAALDTFAE